MTEHHDHSHHGHHHHIDPATGDGRLLAAIVVNVVLTLAEIAGGILAGSLALIADALHNLSDAGALVIAYVARRVARRPADEGMTFGYGRAEIVAALVNYTALILIGIWLGGEAIHRLLLPEPVKGWPMVLISILALGIDLATAALTFAMSRNSLNIRAAFLHNLSDAAASVAAILAGVMILWLGWYWVDPAVTLLIAGYMLWLAAREIGPVIRILMMGAPAGQDAETVATALTTITGIADVHHARLWAVSEREACFDGHLVIDDAYWPEAHRIKSEARTLLARRFDVRQSTLETEPWAEACAAAPRLGGAA